jgi:uncharacterized protein
MNTVEHLPGEQKFLIRCGDAEAYLHYRLLPAATKTAIDFDSTWVPPECRGKGIAEKLVRGGINWAKQQGYEMHASCWYAAKFLR